MSVWLRIQLDGWTHFSHDLYTLQMYRDFVVLFNFGSNKIFLEITDVLLRAQARTHLFSKGPTSINNAVSVTSLDTVYCCTHLKHTSTVYSWSCTLVFTVLFLFFLERVVFVEMKPKLNYKYHWKNLPTMSFWRSTSSVLQNVQFMRGSLEYKIRLAWTEEYERWKSAVSKLNKFVLNVGLLAFITTWNNSVLFFVTFAQYICGSTSKVESWDQPQNAWPTVAVYFSCPPLLTPAPVFPHSQLLSQASCVHAACAGKQNAR